MIGIDQIHATNLRATEKQSEPMPQVTVRHDCKCHTKAMEHKRSACAAKGKQELAYRRHEHAKLTSHAPHVQRQQDAWRGKTCEATKPTTMPRNETSYIFLLLRKQERSQKEAGGAAAPGLILQSCCAAPSMSRSLHHALKGGGVGGGGSGAKDEELLDDAEYG